MTKRHPVRNTQFFDVSNENCSNSEGQDEKVGSRDAIVVFKVNVAETCNGESIKVVGSHPALGTWSAAEGLPLTTDSKMYPSWRATVLLEAPDDCLTTFTVEYKYVRDRRALDVKPGEEFVLEPGVENRRATISIECPFKEQLVEDKYLGESACKLHTLLGAQGQKYPAAVQSDAPIYCVGTFDEKYNLVRPYTPIAVGGPARILWCQSRSSRKTYVVKSIERSRLLKEEKKNLFGIRRRQGEMELHAQTKHPNIVRLFEAFVNPEKVALVLEACYGGDLHDAIKKQRTDIGGGFSELVAAICMQQLLRALEFLHAGGIVHRDVKSENLLVVEKGTSLEDCTFKLADFGFAACLHQTKGGFLRTVMGSPNYVAPEIIRAQSYATAVDLWSSGVVFHHLLVGYLPFRASTSRATLKKVQVGTFKTNGDGWKSIGKDAQDLLYRLMTYNVFDRIRAVQALGHCFFLVVGSSRETMLPESVSSAERESTMYASDYSLCDTEGGVSEKHFLICTQELAPKPPVVHRRSSPPACEQSALDSVITSSSQQAAHGEDVEFDAWSSSSSTGSARGRSRMEEMLQETDSSSLSDGDDEDERFALEPFVYRKSLEGDDDNEKPRACFHHASDSTGLSTAFWDVMHYFNGRGNPRAPRR